MEAVINRKQTSFRLNTDLIDSLRAKARKANMSLNQLVESALMDFAYSIPNEETVAAIEEARSGKYVGTIDMTNFETFMKSVNEIR